MKNKAFLLTIVVIMSLLLCVSCGNDRDYDAAEVIGAAKELIKKSEKLNDIYYGYGIQYEKNESEANGSYYPADYTSLSKFGVNTPLPKLSSISDKRQKRPPETSSWSGVIVPS